MRALDQNIALWEIADGAIDTYDRAAFDERSAGRSRRLCLRAA
jgi:hypothetical protein